MRYALAFAREKAIESSYRHYIADSIHLLGQSKYFSKRWEPQKRRAKDFDVQKVIDDVINRACLGVIEDDDVARLDGENRH